MRILYVISELSLGGAQKQVVELSRELVRRGHEVAIYTLNRDVPRRVELAGSSVTLIVDQKQFRLDPAVLWRLRSAIGSWQPDIIHGFLFDGDFYARVAAWRTGIPVLNSERSSNYRLSVVQKIGHLLTRHLAHGVVANTYAGRDFAQRLFALPAENLHVTLNGVNLTELGRNALVNDDYRNVYFGAGNYRVACLVGAIKPEKDYHLALAVAARLIADDPCWRVLFIGDKLTTAGTYRPGARSDTSAYKAAVLCHYMQLGLSDMIKFAGLRTDVPAIVSQCDVLYLTSRHEGFPNVVLEAMALGVPVVSTDYSDIRRILPLPWQVVASREPEDIAAAIIRAYAQHERVAAVQRKWVEDNATIEKAAAQLEQVYRRYVRPQVCSQSA